MVTNWITNIEGTYKNDPATDDGYVVKIPLNPISKVNLAILYLLSFNSYEKMI